MSPYFMDGGAMPTVHRSIEIPAPRAAVQDAWDHFLHDVLIGKRRLACDDVACVSAVDSGVVGFEALDGDRTRLTLSIPLSVEEPDEARELVGHKASHDLIVFWTYLDSGDYTLATGRHFSNDELRSGRHSVREHVSSDSEGLSVRRSFRA
jgi:hypothetical protein